MSWFIRKTRCSKAEGFTLVEMAVVLIIMGMIMMAVYPALMALRKAGHVTVTQNNMETLMRATAAFVQANGCLPCPALPGGARANFGHMGYSSTDIVCGVCTAPQGIPPFITLGIPPSVAHDGWGHWITMRVDPTLTNPTDIVTPPTLPCTTDDVATGRYGCTTVGTSIKGLCMAATGSANSDTAGINVTTITLSGVGATQAAAILFLSHGSTGYGSYQASPRTLSYRLPFDQRFNECNAPFSGFAQCNSASMDSHQFYDAPKIMNDGVAGSSGASDFYDDILIYASRNALVSMLGNGACSSTW